MSIQQQHSRSSAWAARDTASRRAQVSPAGSRYLLAKGERIEDGQSLDAGRIEVIGLTGDALDLHHPSLFLLPDTLIRQTRAQHKARASRWYKTCKSMSPLKRWMRSQRCSDPLQRSAKELTTPSALSSSLPWAVRATAIRTMACLRFFFHPVACSLSFIHCSLLSFVSPNLIGVPTTFDASLACVDGTA